MNHSTSLSTKDRTIRIVNTQLAVGLVLLLVGLPFHLVIKRLLPGPIGTYWKEGLLGLLILLWAIRCVVERRLLLTGTPLDGAVLAYLGLLVLRFAIDRLQDPGSALVGMWGLYMSVLYLPLYWLIPTAMRWPQQTRTPSAQRAPLKSLSIRWLLLLLVGVGGILALGGLVEFLLDVSLWPSDEIRQRLGYPDFYIYGSHIRRVYFTLDSPTTLANTLAMLLPLGLALVFTPSSPDSFASARRWTVLRIASGIASLLMATCIVVTFSRGIWVATTLSLLVMAVLGGFARSLVAKRQWAAVIVAATLVVLVGLAWATVLKIRTSTSARPEANVVELAPQAYSAAPVVEIRQKLIEDTPLHGQAVIQSWTLLDPIAGTPDTKTVLYEHPPKQGKAELVYRIQVPPITDSRPALRFSVALSPAVWSPDKGDGTSFQIYLTDAKEPRDSQVYDEGVFVFARYLNPKHNPSDRRWRNFVIDLSPWASRTMDIALITEAGPMGNWAFDWGGWAHLQIVTVEPEIFGNPLDNRQNNAIVRHALSILDWARDETNRDRLAAWNLSWTAWRASPLWGQGLGTTGAAALRTHPERAFVTESQVLKSLVELGVPGLLTLAYLWFQIARTGRRAYRHATRDAPEKKGVSGHGAQSSGTQMLLWGILTSLTIVFIEGWVYQNLESKQVNAYFWVMVGLLGLLAYRPKTND